MRSFVVVLFVSVASVAMANDQSDFGAPRFLAVAENPDGSVRMMTRDEAFAFCEKLGHHLPDARELGWLAKSYGAAGIWTGPQPAPNSYWQITHIENADRSRDEFYYSNAGYQRPTGEHGSIAIWSSSVGDNLGSVYGSYFFHTVNGLIFPTTLQRSAAVRCAI